MEDRDHRFSIFFKLTFLAGMVAGIALAVYDPVHRLF